VCPREWVHLLRQNTTIDRTGGGKPHGNGPGSAEKQRDEQREKQSENNLGGEDEERQTGAVDGVAEIRHDQTKAHLFLILSSKQCPQKNERGTKAKTEEYPSNSPPCQKNSLGPSLVSSPSPRLVSEVVAEN